MATHVYLIRALTNLHVGSGEAGYGVVDKTVQRDPTTNLPTIHMSGIKGALREQLKNALDEKSDHERSIFGSAVKEDADKIQQGKVRFISADLLAYPQPSKSSTVSKPFKMVTSESIKTAFLEKVKCFGLEFDWAGTQVQGEDWEAMKKHDDFRKLTDELPVIARNYLEDGTSKNLWYEEFVPREAVFGTLLQGPEELLAVLKTKLDNQVFQIGANATVGYGYCLFTLKGAA
jgi:CRISPR-associated protein Cmr4